MLRARPPSRGPTREACGCGFKFHAEKLSEASGRPLTSLARGDSVIRYRKHTRAAESLDSGPSDSEPKLVVKKGAPPWVYYRVIVGCDDRMLDVQFSFTAAGSGAKPRVYLRKGRLPLMLPETYDYVDLYTESGGWQQRIVASSSC